MRYLPSLASVSLLLVSCVSAPSDATSKPGDAVVSAEITLTAKGKSKLMPSSSVSPGFSSLNVDVITADDMVRPASDVVPGGAASLGHTAMQGAAPSCEVIGCAWTLAPLGIDATLQGLMSVVSDGRQSAPVWHTTYAMVVNANQIQDNAKLGGAVNAFAPAYVLANSAVDQLAKLLNTDSNSLVARGVGLGLVWSTRGEGEGIGTGFAGARITVGSTDGTSPTLFYLNDDMTLLSQTGTNQDGLFVLLGADPAVPGTTAPSSYKVPLTVTNATSAGVYADSMAIVRPGTISVVPVIPRR